MIFCICFLDRSISIICSRNLRISILKCLKNGSYIPRGRRTSNFWWVNNFWNDQAWVFLRRVFPQKVKEGLEIPEQNWILRSPNHNFPARISFQCSSQSCYFQFIHKGLLLSSNTVSERMVVHTINTLQQITRVTRGSSH